MMKDDVRPIFGSSPHCLHSRLLTRTCAGSVQAIYISTCRGPVTDDDALIDALNSGSIYGAGLDVITPDPNTDSPLLDMDNVIVLPHMAPVGTPPERALGFMMDNLRRLQEGTPLLSVVNGPGHSDGIFDGVEVAAAAPAARL